MRCCASVSGAPPPAQAQELKIEFLAKYGKVPYYSEVNYAAAKSIDLTLAKHKGTYPCSYCE